MRCCKEHWKPSGFDKKRFETRSNIFGRSSNLLLLKGTTFQKHGMELFEPHGNHQDLTLICSLLESGRAADSLIEKRKATAIPYIPTARRHRSVDMSHKGPWDMVNATFRILFNDRHSTQPKWGRPADSLVHEIKINQLDLNIVENCGCFLVQIWKPPSNLSGLNSIQNSNCSAANARCYMTITSWGRIWGHYRTQ